MAPASALANGLASSGLKPELVLRVAYSFVVPDCVSDCLLRVRMPFGAGGANE